jgi:beta-lactamase superfamily II metal-dependent hydrolase
MKRYMVNKIRLTVALLFAWVSAAAQSRLEIHHLGVGDGDATLIIAIDETATGFVDTSTVLIDANRTQLAGTRIWEYVNEQLTALFPPSPYARKRKLDGIVLSHTHLDHFGGMPTFLNLLYESGWDLPALLDREGTQGAEYYKHFKVVSSGLTDVSVFDPSYGGKVDFFDCTDDVDLPTFSGKAKEYILASQKLTRITVLPGNDLFETKKYKNISMVCLAAMGISATINPTYFTIFLPQRTNGYFVPVNDNDLSFVFNLGFKTFNYFLGGDIGGNKPYADGETPICQFLNAKFPASFHYCGIKVSHHGSDHSSNDLFLATSKPTIAVVPAELRKYGKGALPREATITNLIKNGMPAQNIKYCFIPNDPLELKSYWTIGNRAAYQDIVIKVTDLPIAGKDIKLHIYAQTRNNNTLERTGGPAASEITCTKMHQSTFKPDIHKLWFNVFANY